MVRGIADGGKAVQYIRFQGTGNRDKAAHDLIDLRIRIQFLKPAERHAFDAFASIRTHQEPGAEIRDIRFPLRETPDITVVNEVMSLPERKIIRARENSLHLNVNAGARFAGFLYSLYPETPRDARFNAFRAHDHLRPNLYALRGGHHGKGADAAFDTAYTFHAGVHGDSRAVKFRKVSKPRIEFFTIEHNAHIFAADIQINSARAVNRSEEHTSELQSPDHLVCRL